MRSASESRQRTKMDARFMGDLRVLIGGGSEPSWGDDKPWPGRGQARRIRQTGPGATKILRENEIDPLRPGPGRPLGRDPGLSRRLPDPSPGLSSPLDG